MDLETQLSGSQSAQCVGRIHGYVNSVGLGVGGVDVTTARMTRVGSYAYAWSCIILSASMQELVHVNLCRRSNIPTSWHTQGREWASIRRYQSV